KASRRSDGLSSLFTAITRSRTRGPSAFRNGRISSSPLLNALAGPLDDRHTLFLLHLWNVSALRPHPVEPRADTRVGSQLETAVARCVRPRQTGISSQETGAALPLCCGIDYFTRRVLPGASPAPRFSRANSIELPAIGIATPLF